MKEITINEIRSSASTYSVKDDSPRGVKTVAAAAVKVGDMVVINDEFALVVDAPAQPEAEQEAGDFTAPAKIENAEADHAEAQRELERAEHAVKARREAYLKTLRVGTKSEETEEAHAALESAERALTDYRIYAAILEENARAAWLSENLPKICAVLNKYTGRKIGEKTRDKINEELTAAIGCRAGVSLARECYERDHVYINAPYWSQWLELHKQYPADKFRDADGKMLKFTPEDFTTTADFCTNPNAKLREILAAHAALMAARETLQAAISNYNCAVGRVFERANVSEWYQQPNITPAKR